MRIFTSMFVLFLVSTLGCAEIGKLGVGIAQRKAGGGLIAVTNTVALSICRIDVVQGDDVSGAALYKNMSYDLLDRNRIPAGGSAFVQLPKIDKDKTPTFELKAHPCEGGADQIVAASGSLRSEDIPRYHSENITLH